MRLENDNIKKAIITGQITSPGSTHETGCSELVHWDDPEEWDAEGGGRGFKMGET